MSTATITRTSRVDTLRAHATKYDAYPTYEMLLLAAFADAGTTGLTAEEAGSDADLLHTGYWKRVSDLANNAYISTKQKSVTVHGMWGDYKKWEPVTRIGTSGRQQQVWTVTTWGRNALAAYKRDLKAQAAKAA